MAVILAMTAIAGWAVATNRISYVVTEGVSMNPVYYQNDLVVVVKDDSYEVGQIAAYHGSGGIKVLHRIVGGDNVTGFEFRGDNNPNDDAVTPTAGQLIGRAVLHLPQGGTWLAPLLSPTGLGMLGFVLVGGGATARVTRRQIARGRRKKRVAAMTQGGPWALARTVTRAAGRLSPPLQSVAGIAAAAALLALVIGFLGWRKPAMEARTTGTGQSVTFSYAATVKKSAAYDGTTVTSPDPIFRKLATKVNLRMRYAGPPGTLDATVRLANEAGWHTTMPLAPAQSFTTGGADRTVLLDLDSIEERARSAAKAIGINSSTVSVTVNAHVVSPGLPDFTGSLALQLVPIQLALPGGASALHVTDPASTIDLVPRRLSFLGSPGMTAGVARGWSLLLLLGAALGAGAVYLLDRRGAGPQRREDIERRYGHLLVPVAPMRVGADDPVITVDTFPALVRLAERYGQMILTWRGTDTDDFVVRDDGITYRYRIEGEETPERSNLDRPHHAESVATAAAADPNRTATDPHQEKDSAPLT